MTDKEKLENLLCETGMGKTESAFVADSLVTKGVTIRESGIWVWNSRELHWECSRCGCIRAHDLMLGLNASFCGKCGAKMKGTR